MLYCSILESNQSGVQYFAGIKSRPGQSESVTIILDQSWHSCKKEKEKKEANSIALFAPVQSFQSIHLFFHNRYGLKTSLIKAA